jgi:hypothetical protein
MILYLFVPGGSRDATPLTVEVAPDVSRDAASRPTPTPQDVKLRTMQEGRTL